MAVWVKTVAATLFPATGGSYALDVTDGQATLDEGSSPYVQMALTITTPDQTVLDQIDPRLNPRITVVVGATDTAGMLAHTSRTFNLLLTARTIDHNAGTTALGLACDEAALQNYALVSTTPDTSALTYQTSVHNIINNVVLSKIGAQLHQNLFTNPTGKLTTAGYVAVGTGSIGQDAGADTYFQASGTVVSGAGGLTIETMAVGGGKLLPTSVYTYSATVYAGVGTGGAISYLPKIQVSGTGVASATQVVSTVQAFTRISITFTTIGSGNVSFSVLNTGASMGTGNVVAFRDAQLEPGPVRTTFQDTIVDADFTTLTAVTNMFPAPNMETGAPSWLDQNGLAGSGGIEYSTTWASSGTTSLRLTAAAADSWGGLLAETSGTMQFDLQPGQTYTIAADVHCGTVGSGTAVSVAARERGISVFCSPTATPTTYTEFHSNSATNVANTTTRVYNTFTVPTNATTLFIRFYVGHTVGVFYFDNVLLTPDNGLETDGTNPYVYWDGSSTDTAKYNYGWTGTTNDSTSTRTPVFERDPSSLTWNPGVSAYSFSSTILQASALRLFCDENRNWILTDNTYVVSGVITVASGFNLYTATDTISQTATAVDGSPLYFSSIVIQYQWNDSTNTPQTRWDVAGSGGPCYLLQKQNVVYPGPGAAAYWLSRATGQGRTLALNAAINYSATPGQSVSATVPFTDLQTGYLSSVIWSFGSEDFMTVGTRGLVDTPADSWALAVGTWATQTATWATYG